MTKNQALKEFKKDWDLIIKTYPWLNSRFLKLEAWEEYIKYLYNQEKITKQQFWNWENPFT